MENVNDELRRAAEMGAVAQLNVLLRLPGCDLLSKSCIGMTALMQAAFHGQTSCAKILLPGSDALDKDQDGMTALMWAARHGNASCTQLLIPASNALARDVFGRAALEWAARSGNHSCVRFLLPVSDPWVKDKDGLTASAHARDRSHGGAAALIEAYMLALSEAAAMDACSGAGEPKRSSALRV